MEIGSNNLTRLITNFLKESSALSKEDICAKFLCFGVDRATVFQGNRNGITLQLIREFALFLLGILAKSYYLVPS